MLITHPVSCRRARSTSLIGLKGGCCGAVVIGLPTRDTVKSREQVSRRERLTALASAVCAAILTCWTTAGWAQEHPIGVVSQHADVDADGDKDDKDLAQQLNNPVASLISVPFQNNYDTGFGPKDADRVNLNIQPVIPFRLSEDWNLISRTILPITYLGSTAPGVDSAFGLGDTVQSLFLSPVELVGGWILGAGPVFLLPTATDSAFQSRQLGLGPTAVGLRQEGGWTYGALVNHIWGVTNPDTRDQVNATFLQPFIAHTFESATTLSVNTESTYDWDDEEWTVPINASVSQLVRVGEQPINFQFTGRYFAEAPSGGPEWGARFTVTFLFPN